MRAGLRWTMLLVAGLVLIPAAAFAQSTPDPAPSSTSGTDAVGPQELQNFTLSGSVSKPADQQAASPPAAVPPPKAVTAGDQPPPATAGRREQPGNLRSRRSVSKPALSATAGVASAKAPIASTANTPAANVPPTGSTSQFATVSEAVQAPQLPATPVVTPTVSLAPEHKLFIWPWLLAAMALAGATLFLLWRRRQQAAFAGGSQFDLFVPPEPAPVAAPPASPAPALPRTVASPLVPRPPAAPAKEIPPASTGIVSTRLRPSLELVVQPLLCRVDDERVVFEFELELFNSGAAPARAVLAEAMLFNAGANQDQELASFFANPVGAGERLEVIPPMKRMNFVNQVVAPRAALQEYELAGRKVFVPILAFNALYSWSGGKAQTSVAYLVGRETGNERLGPFSLDNGPRQIGKLAVRPLPTTLRT